MTNDWIKKIKVKANHNGHTIVNVSVTNRQRRLVSFYSTVSTHTEYQGYRYYRNRANNDHQVREGYDQSVNYFGKMCVKILNNSFARLSNNDNTNSKPFAFFTEHCTVIFQKFDKKYYINGNKCTKSRLNAIIPSIMMRMNVEKNSKSFKNFVDMIVDSDPVISAAIVNKIEYTFYDNTYTKVETLLNIEKTGKEYSAIELYEGVWVEFKDTQMKSFINACRGNKNKFTGVSPEELYYLSRGEFLSKSEIQVVYAFLEQNRKSALVEQRSLELFKDLTERFKGKIFEREMLVEGNKKQSMGVRGKQLDWLVVDRGYKAGRQDVSTYAVISLANYSRTTDRSGYSPKDSSVGLNTVHNESVYYNKGGNEKYVLLGPICIDQAHTDISIGDQFAARSMALLNDIHSFKHVSTLRNYDRIKPEIRVDWDALSILYGKE
jgi:hypothetical protein